VDTHLLLKQAGELFGTILETETVGSVDNPDQGVCLLEVVAPVAPQSLLATDIPFFPPPPLVCQDEEDIRLKKGHGKQPVASLPLTDVQLVATYIVPS